MGLFKSAEEKEQIKQEKTLKQLEKYGLTDLTDERDIEAVKHIVFNLIGTGLMDVGAALSLTEKNLLRVLVDYEKSIFEQNMIIIRMLNKIANK